MKRYKAVTFALGLVLAALPIQGAYGQGDTIIVSDADRHAGEFIVPLNKSQILRVDQPFNELRVGNDTIADVQPLTTRSVYVLGREIGSTSLTIYGPDRQLIAVADLVVGNDVRGLRARLNEIMPDESIEVRNVGDSVVLSGRVSSAARVDQAVAVAGRYVGGADNVTNLLSVAGSQQVMLKVRFAEVSRSIGKDLAVNTQLSGQDVNVATGIGRLLGGALNASGVVNTSLFGSDIALSLALDALESKNLVKTLAEPNLITLSGDTANFLAGGEFPIPVAQDDDGVTVEFKEFGVSLGFTPTVLSNGLINVVVRPEVSQIDNTFAQVVQGLSVPGLSTRRAETTVELRDGQSFAIAGLLQDDFQDTVDQVPGLGNVPVLGTLFRSTNYQRNQTELVILITVHLVQPVAAGTLAAPTDTFVAPTEWELFSLGQLEGAPEQAAARAGGGLDGSYGYAIE